MGVKRSFGEVVVRCASNKFNTVEQYFLKPNAIGTSEAREALKTEAPRDPTSLPVPLPHHCAEIKAFLALSHDFNLIATI